jgi:hypothetical protein
MATTATMRIDQGNTCTTWLFLAFELGVETWKVGFTMGVAQRPRERSVRAGEVRALREEIGRAKRRFALADDAQVVSCSEAGRDGFWLHRLLVAHGIENLVVDSSSIEVNGRQRRAKTDRLDVHQRLTMLLRHLAGEKKVWTVVRVPSVADEDRRQLHRELLTAKRARTRGRIASKAYWRAMECISICRRYTRPAGATAAVGRLPTPIGSTDPSGARVAEGMSPPGERTVEVISGVVWPRECSGPEDRHRGAGPEAVNRALAALGDGIAPAGSVA